ncbi:conserved hypothetical protein [Vibrio nigripulchritudo MADA3029]|uniref:Outer membrane protein beta-barrel domain-containing protein n=1 Tax=Vibrio nigripulchritudo TaxID=28173 RepID=U4K732_9VIBR|nr:MULTISPECIES: hypothetical protein [Vibrio]EGU55898.1 hypothetical protein VINI7043_27225 [Vibrio nigripulchritudo ATCC 27043]UAB69332.1 hypothetical protein INR79_12385 [Vibrio sp. SCSIO 43132]CCN48271.1 conserved hypothetical protein [Vibrio nigripulchritudo MADA3020]CCN54893.1 conserved hypothetical protein [Vibrio nigripulchritudo MADA3021]CCN58232.1 conserved hypothetical protein [Vibrio nigripulchritudo MADA3029]
MKAVSRSVAGVAMLLTVVAQPVFAESNQKGEWKLGMGLDQGLSVVAQYKDTYNFAIGNHGISADYLLKKGQFESSEVPFTWYFGAGAWIGWEESFGPRMPLGLDWDFAKGWDAYAQVAPGLNIHKGINLGLDASVGVRYSF